MCDSMEKGEINVKSKNNNARISYFKQCCMIEKQNIHEITISYSQTIIFMRGYFQYCGNAPLHELGPAYYRNDHTQTEVGDYRSWLCFRQSQKTERKMEPSWTWSFIVLLQLCDSCLVGASGKTCLGVKRFNVYTKCR